MGVKSIDNFCIFEYVRDIVSGIGDISVNKIDDNNIYIEKNGKRAYAKFDGNIFYYRIESDDIELGRRLEALIVFCQRDILFFSSGIVSECMDLLRRIFRVLNIILLIASIVSVFVDKTLNSMWCIIFVSVLMNFVELCYMYKLVDEAKGIEKAGNTKMGHAYNNNRMGEKNA